jgi:hypothetical protein
MYRLLLILVIVGELVWLAATIPSLNILADSYRRNERDKALVAWATNKTPATQAAFDKEDDLLVRHRNFVDGMTICVFLEVDIFGFYLFWNYGKSKPMA